MHWPKFNYDKGFKAIKKTPFYKERFKKKEYPSFWPIGIGEAKKENERAMKGEELPSEKKSLKKPTSSQREP